MASPTPAPTGPTLRRLAGGVLMLAAAGLAVPAVAALSGVGHRWIDILAQFPAPALSAIAAVGVAALALRARWAVAAAAIALILNAAALAPQWAPPRGGPPADAGRLRLYFANLRVTNADVEAVSRSVRAADADVVALVEVGPAPLAALDRILADHPYRLERAQTGRAMRASLILASRQPLGPPREPSGQVTLLARAETAIGPVTVGATHLTRPWPFYFQWAQLTQAQNLAATAAGTDGPLVVAGDFNSVSGARVGRILKDAGLIPAPAFPGTWPADLPAPLGLTIDHVWRTPDLVLVSRRLGRPTGSDHRPVITEFARAPSRP